MIIDGLDVQFFIIIIEWAGRAILFYFIF